MLADAKKQRRFLPEDRQDKVFVEIFVKVEFVASGCVLNLCALVKAMHSLGWVLRYGISYRIRKFYFSLNNYVFLKG